MSKINSRAIEEKFNSFQDALVLQQSDLSLKSISDMVDSGAIDISPKYQRRERWNSKKESELIESFILNIPVPPIYLSEDSYGTYSVIDGKQRITAINNFLNGKFRLKELDKFTDIDDCKFEDLPSAIQNALKIRPYLRVVTLLRQSDANLKYEVFLRLNKAGVALNSQEIRNVAFRGELNDLLFDLSRDDYFNSLLRASEKSKTYSEMIDVQYVLRFFTVREYWESFPGNMDQAMDQFMKDNYRAKGKAITTLRSIFESALDACNTIWGNNAFIKPNASRRVLQGVYDVQMVCLSLLSEIDLKRVLEHADDVRSAFEREILDNQEFSESVSQFTSNPRNMKYRINRFLEILRSV